MGGRKGRKSQHVNVWVGRLITIYVYGSVGWSIPLNVYGWAVVWVGVNFIATENILVGVSIFSASMAVWVGQFHRIFMGGRELLKLTVNYGLQNNAFFSYYLFNLQ